MRVGIMQPYFFPYIGYMSLIKHTERFILFDGVQFIRHGWIERNRILKPGEGWQYISVPLVKHSRECLIKDVCIRNEEQWREKILSQLNHYKKRAPFYKDVVAVVHDALNINTNSITILNQNVLKVVCAYLGIPFESEIYSGMNIEMPIPKEPDEWALNICKALGYDEYWNPPGGMEFFKREKYQEAGIKLVFQKVNIKPYSQRRGVDKIEVGLSILDVMMFNSIEAIHEMMDDYELY